MRIVVLCLHGPKSVLAVPTAVSRLQAAWILVQGFCRPLGLIRSILLQSTFSAGRVLYKVHIIVKQRTAYFAE